MSTVYHFTLTIFVYMYNVYINHLVNRREDKKYNYVTLLKSKNNIISYLLLLRYTHLQTPDIRF